jgi:hypothetical protein
VGPQKTLRKELGCLLHYRADQKGVLWNLSSFNATELLPIILVHRGTSRSKGLLRGEVEKLFAVEGQNSAIDFVEVISSTRATSQFSLCLDESRSLRSLDKEGGEE